MVMPNNSPNVGQTDKVLSTKKINVVTTSISDQHREHAMKSQNEFENNKTTSTDATEKKRRGRPKVDGPLMEERIHFYLTKDMKKHLLDTHGTTTEIRRFLLKEAGYPGTIK